MEIVFKNLMLAAFITAMCVMAFHLAEEQSSHPVADRVIAVSMSAGFIFGGVCRALAAPLAWDFTLYILGAMVSYTATLFSFPSAGKRI